MATIPRRSSISATASAKSAIGKRCVTIGSRSRTRSEISPTTRDEVELGRGRRSLAGEDDLGGAEPARELELVLAHAEGDDARRRMQAQKGDGQRAERPDADHADRLAGLGGRLLEAAQDDRRRLDEDAGVEGDVLGQAVHDLLGHRDELGVAARPGEPERLDALAPLRLAAAAAPAAMADDEALADDAVAHVDGLHVGPDLDDGARPLVAGDDREAHPSRVGEDAGHHLDVGPAQTGLAAVDEDVGGPHDRRRHLSVGDLVRSLDDDRPHARKLF